MITVGQRFPAFTLQGINSNNEFVEVSVTEHYGWRKQVLYSRT